MIGSKNLRIGGIVLAAGGSTRLGRPKQFLELEGVTLLRRSAEAMCSSDCDPVVVVLGAEKERGESELADLRVGICVNRGWRSGMSSSIKLGLQELLLIEPAIDAVIITLCDQPFVNAQTITRLAQGFAGTGKQIVAAEYDGVAGVPALFSSGMFKSLSMLEGDKGARDLIRDPNASVETIQIKEAAIDIDIPDDFDRLRSS